MNSMQCNLYVAYPLSVNVPPDLHDSLAYILHNLYPQPFVLMHASRVTTIWYNIYKTSIVTKVIVFFTDKRHAYLSGQAADKSKITIETQDKVKRVQC